MLAESLGAVKKNCEPMEAPEILFIAKNPLRRAELLYTAHMLGVLLYQGSGDLDQNIFRHLFEVCLV